MSGFEFEKNNGYGYGYQIFSDTDADTDNFSSDTDTNMISNIESDTDNYPYLTILFERISEFSHPIIYSLEFELYNTQELRLKTKFFTDRVPPPIDLLYVFYFLTSFFKLECYFLLFSPKTFHFFIIYSRSSVQLLYEPR
jgi:hypothetical protein